MKVRIVKAECVGNARCEAIAPGLYPLDEEGFIEIDGFDVEPGQEKLALNGAKACPERIIFVIDDASGEEQQIWPPAR